MPARQVFLVGLFVGLVLSLGPVAGRAAVQSNAPAQVSQLTLEGVGKGTVPLNGPWQFHLGDDQSWAQPATDDSGWEQITADSTWGSQSHPNYQGYAWYRRHIHVSPAPGASADFALLIPPIDDVYEIYWNGVPVGHLGSFPPNADFFFGLPAQTYGLGPVRDGVLAVRVFRYPLGSNDDGTGGGFERTPILGSPAGIASAKDALDYHWIRGQQFRFGLTLLYGLAALISLIAWLRDRNERLLFWMALFTFWPILEYCVNSLRLPISGIWLTFIIQTTIQMREVSQWFVLLYLLQLSGYNRLARILRFTAIVSMIAGCLDGALGFTYPSLFTATQYQIADAALTVFILPGEVIPALLVIYAIVRRKRLDFSRWLVAILAMFNALTYSVSNIAQQGSRFTHWTISPAMNAPLFIVFGNPFNILLVFRTLLFLSILYAVIRYSIETRGRQAALEQEFQNARELQQVLVPETLPALPGFALTSAYRPAQEVGGDFFQIIPLGKCDAESCSTLVILGDVSGKGLRAAMAVSLIVGAARMIAEYTSSPAEILAALNRRLYGRLQSGFATCLALRLDPDGTCVIASAGHPSPFLNRRELDLPGALPLGLAAATTYEETSIPLGVGDHFALYTDGLLEARSQSGELYGFERLESLFATHPNAAQATEAAVSFGQDDDITVLTLTRLAVGQEPTVLHSVPALTPA